MKLSPLLACVLVCLVPLRAGAVELCWIFNNGMVLQADRPVPVWGQGTPGEQVTVRFADQVVTTQVDAQGEWAVKLAPLAASAKGLPLTIEAASNNRSFADVLVGDVWICGGQSNMAMPVLKDTTGGLDEAAKPANPLLRVFTLPNFRWSMEPQRRQFPWSTQLVWGPTTEQTPGVPYYFGTALQPQAGRPLGLIVTPVGSSTAEAWIPMADLETLPWLHTFIANSKKWAAEHAFREKPSQLSNDPGLWPRWWASTLYNAHIAPLRQFAVRGVIWYQGEANTNSSAGPTADGPRFVTLMKTLIGAWRSQFDQPELPFLIVQLSMYGRGSRQVPEPNQPSPWAVIREAQAAVAKQVLYTGFVASWDIGEKDDIHPRNKRPVGERLASLALHQVYGKPVATTGPRYAAHKVVEGKVRVHFSEVGEGLAVRGDRLTGFAIAGENRRFFWAEAVIEGEDVVLSCPQVSRPVAVRFAYGDFWPASLFNRAGWPATPFRTDDWPLVQTIPVPGPHLRVLRGGESTELSVAVPEGGGGSFQWYRNGRMLPGQTGPALRVDFATEEADGAYWVECVEPFGSRRSEITFVRRQARAPRVIGRGTASSWTLPASSQNAEVVALIPGGNYAHAVRANGTLLRWGGSPYAGSDDAYLTTSGQVVGLGLSQSGRRAVLTAPGQLVFSGPGSWARMPENRSVAEPTTANTVFALSTSPYHGLAVRTDGTVLAWGDNVGNQATVPVGLTGVCAVAAGTNHSLALLANGQVVAWGSNSEGQCDVPNLTDVIAVAAGCNYSLALRSNGTVVAWGKGECVPPPVDLAGVVAIGASLQPAPGTSALAESAWALTKAGRVVIWGNNLAAKAVVPSDLPSALGVVAGPGYTLALVAGTVSYGDFVDQVTWDKSPQVQAALANAGGDFDGDGQTNFLEYALGSDPLAAEVYQGPDIIEREGHLYFTYQRRRDNPGLIYQPEASSDLRTWVAGPTVFEECEVRTIDPERDQVIVRDRWMLQPGQGRFLRLKINP